MQLIQKPDVSCAQPQFNNIAFNPIRGACQWRSQAKNFFWEKIWGL